MMKFPWLLSQLHFGLARKIGIWSIFLFVGLVLVACSTPMATPSANNVDRIALSTSRGWFSSETYVVSAEGSGPITEKLPAGLEDSPAWSPNGQWIVFKADRTLYIARWDGSRRRRLTNTEPFPALFDPAWSPDGKYIVYHSAQDTKRTGLYVLSVECILQGKTCDLQPVFLVAGYAPDWSPDGKQIVYEGKGGISVIDADGASEGINLAPSLTRCRNPKWSPDGTKIVTSCDHEDYPNIFVINRDGSGIVNLTHDKVSDTHPSWLPDGSKIAFISKREGLGRIIGAEHISDAVFLMNADGTNVIRLSLRNDEMVIWYAWLPSSLKKAVQ